MNPKKIQYLDADYMKHIENLKTEIKHVYILFFLWFFALGCCSGFFIFKTRDLLRLK